MPNWCANNLEIKSTKENILAIETALDDCKGKNFFDIFVPNSEQAGQGDDWYSYNLETYGCKWNCDANDWIVSENHDRITIQFDSPWGPPVALFEKLFDEGYEINAQYFEPGMCFVGEFVDGIDCYYEYTDCTSETVTEEVPYHLLENWGIVEMLQDNEENQMDEEEEDDSSTKN